MGYRWGYGRVPWSPRRRSPPSPLWRVAVPRRPNGHPRGRRLLWHKRCQQLPGALLVEHVMFPPLRYVAPFVFLMFFYKHHSETKKHWVACVLNGWSWLVMLFSICFFVLPKGMFLKRGGFSTEKKRLSSEVKVGVCCNQKICRIFWWKIHETRQVFSCNDIFGSWVGQS